MKPVLLMIAVLLCSQAVLARQDTVITTTDGQVTSVEKIDRPPPESAFMSFEEADKNGDGCVDRQEARDAGILRFGRFDRRGTGCLNREEFREAAVTPDGPAR